MSRISALPGLHVQPLGAAVEDDFGIGDHRMWMRTRLNQW